MGDVPANLGCYLCRRLAFVLPGFPKSHTLPPGKTSWVDIHDVWKLAAPGVYRPGKERAGFPAPGPKSDSARTDTPRLLIRREVDVNSFLFLLEYCFLRLRHFLIPTRSVYHPAEVLKFPAVLRSVLAYRAVANLLIAHAQLCCI